MCLLHCTVTISTLETLWVWKVDIFLNLQIKLTTSDDRRASYIASRVVWCRARVGCRLFKDTQFSRMPARTKRGNKTELIVIRRTHQAGAVVSSASAKKKLLATLKTITAYNLLPLLLFFLIFTLCKLAPSWKKCAENFPGTKKQMEQSKI